MRVAVCISGQMRNYTQCADSIIDNLISPYNADVFIHTWAETGISSSLALYLPDPVRRAIPSFLVHDVGDVELGLSKGRLQTDFPEAYECIRANANESEMVEAEVLTKRYGAKRCVVEQLDREAITRGFNREAIIGSLQSMGLNSIPMYYKIWACDQLMREHEAVTGTHYDIVVRARSDYIFEGTPPLEEIAAAKGGLSTLYCEFYEQLGVTRACFDVFAAGTSSAMNVYAAVWGRLKEYLDPNEYREWPMGARGAESILYKQLTRIDAQDSIYKPNFSLYRKSSEIAAKTLVPLMLDRARRNEAYADFAKALEAIEI